MISRALDVARRARRRAPPPWVPSPSGFSTQQQQNDREDDGKDPDVVLEAYFAGRPMSPAMKHVARTAPQKVRARRTPPSLAAHIARLESRFGPRNDSGADVAAMTALLLDRPDQDEHRRKDLRSLQMITVDSASTVEIDDGLSAEPAGDGLVRVFVHVADPTRYLLPDDRLTHVAGERVRTLYLPHGKRPMLPLELGAAMCSLREGVETPSLTITGVVRLCDGSIVEGSGEVLMSMTRSSARLTYEQADEVVGDASLTSTSTSAISLLIAVAGARRRWRAPRAAMPPDLSPNEPLSETSLTCDEHFNVTLTQTPRVSPSRDMVTELMILAGELFATFGLDNAIPLPYRTQRAAPGISNAPTPFSRRQHLLKSMLAPSPTLPPTHYAHHALGIPAYTQATSPIRRHVDLLAHFNTKSIIRAECLPFPLPRLTTTLATLEKKDSDLTATERAIDHALLCAYIAGLPTAERDKHVSSCTLLRWINQERGLGLLHVPRLGRTLPATINRPATEGQSDLSCTVVAADPFLGTLTLTCN